MALYEKFWKCNSCGTNNSALRNLKCKGCGSPKGKQDEEVFTLEEINDADGIELASGGPHWYCSSCGSVNLDKYTSCNGCGLNKNDSHNKSFKVLDFGESMPEITSVQKDAYAEYKNTGDSFSSGDYSEYAEQEAEQEVEQKQDYEEYKYAASVNESPRTLNLSTKKVKNISFIASGIIAVILLVIWLLSPKEYTATVSQLSWGREINIEVFNKNSGSGWTVPPADAYNVTRETKFKENRDVYRTETRVITVNNPDRTGYKDNGNGSMSSYTIPGGTSTRTESYQVFSHTEPVYSTWYTYDYDRWEYKRKVSAGGLGKNVYWPEYELKDVIGTYGDERKGGSKEKYTVEFNIIVKEEVKPVQRNMDYTEWLEFDVGDTYFIKVNRLGIIVGDPYK